jgi:hypothetical protein
MAAGASPAKRRPAIVRGVFEVAVFGFFLLLSIAYTWPLATNLSTAVADRGDPLLNAFILDWVCHALSHAPLELFNAPFFHPARFPIAFSEHMTGLALLVLPFALAGARAITLHNLALLLSMALGGYGAFVLACVVTRSVLAALLGGVVFGFVSFRFDHLAHVQVLASGWIPLSLAALLLFWRSGSRLHAALFAAAFVMNGLSNIYWLLFASVALGLTVLFLAVVDPRAVRGRARRLAVAAVVAALVLLPFLIPYRIVSETYRMKRTSMESAALSATWSDWISAAPASIVWGSLRPARPERALFPGLVATTLSLAALLLSWRKRPLPTSPSAPQSIGRVTALRVFAGVAALAGCALALHGRITIGRSSFVGSDVPFTLAVAFLIASLPLREIVRRSPLRTELWVALIWVAIGFAGSFGENSFFHPFLFRVFEPFKATRAPARWAVIAFTGLAILAAEGARLAGRRLERRFGRRFGHAAIVALVVLALIESVPRIRWNHVPSRFPDVYYWLAKTRGEVVIELPVSWSEREAYSVLAASLHRVPIMNGVSGFATPLHDELTNGAYDDRMLERIGSNGATLVIVHPEAAAAVRPWVERGDLTEIARFANDDVVYRLASRWRRKPRP